MAEKATGRLEAFSDGVFAIAITLLVLDIKVPRDLPEGVGLGQALLQQWPAYLAFFISFTFIGIMWINHHRIFSLLSQTDHTLLVLNGLLLLGVTVLPFPTALLSEYIGHAEQRIAGLVFNGVFLVIAIFFNILWRYIVGQPGLLAKDADPQAIAAITRSFAYGPVFYLITFGLAFFSVIASLVMSVALAIFYALPGRN
ncbi:MAG: TMEM175 family protein [Chloroflexi bacterium]|nr:TMEM175 family protein [Chloroflexota bacterium]